jgi:hypothetical protein
MLTYIFTNFQIQLDDVPAIATVHDFAMRLQGIGRLLGLSSLPVPTSSNYLAILPALNPILSEAYKRWSRTVNMLRRLQTIEPQMADFTIVQAREKITSFFKYDPNYQADWEEMKLKSFGDPLKDFNALLDLFQAFLMPVVFPQSLSPQVV